MKPTASEWVLRIGIAGTYIGHGVFALQVKQGWIPYLTTVGISASSAAVLMPLIGMLDIIIALFVLLYPARIVLYWAALWAFMTALIRPLSGEPIWEFVERSANWAAPLALLYLRGLPEKWKDLWAV